MAVAQHPLLLLAVVLSPSCAVDLATVPPWAPRPVLRISGIKVPGRPPPIIPRSPPCRDCHIFRCDPNLSCCASCRVIHHCSSYHVGNIVIHTISHGEVGCTCLQYPLREQILHLITLSQRASLYPMGQALVIPCQALCDRSKNIFHHTPIPN